MVFDEFINIIKNDSAVIAKNFAQGVSQSEFTKTYRKWPEEHLIKLGKQVYDNLEKWLAPGTSPEDIGKIYTQIGIDRYEQGFPLCEILYAVHYVKKVLLNHIFSGGILPDTLKLYQTHDFVARVHDFFDLAVFYLSRGFQETIYKKIVNLKGVDNDNIHKIFPAGSFYYEPDPAFRTFEKAMEGFNLFKVK